MPAVSANKKRDIVSRARSWVGRRFVFTPEREDLLHPFAGIITGLTPGLDWADGSFVLEVSTRLARFRKGHFGYIHECTILMDDHSKGRVTVESGRSMPYEGRVILLPR